MPFALNEATRFISPTKTLEYMAARKRVVSTPVPDVVANWGDVVPHRDRWERLRPSGGEGARGGSRRAGREGGARGEPGRAQRLGAHRERDAVPDGRPARRAEGASLTRSLPVIRSEPGVRPATERRGRHPAATGRGHPVCIFGSPSRRFIPIRTDMPARTGPELDQLERAGHRLAAQIAAYRPRPLRPHEGHGLGTGDHPAGAVTGSGAGGVGLDSCHRRVARAAWGGSRSEHSLPMGQALLAVLPGRRTERLSSTQADHGFESLLVHRHDASVPLQDAHNSEYSERSAWHRRSDHLAWSGERRGVTFRGVTAVVRRAGSIRA